MQAGGGRCCRWVLGMIGVRAEAGCGDIMKQERGCCAETTCTSAGVPAILTQPAL